MDRRAFHEIDELPEDPILADPNMFDASQVRRRGNRRRPTNPSAFEFNPADLNADEFSERSSVDVNVDQNDASEPGRIDIRNNPAEFGNVAENVLSTSEINPNASEVDFNVLDSENNFKKFRHIVVIPNADFSRPKVTIIPNARKVDFSVLNTTIDFSYIYNDEETIDETIDEIDPNVLGNRDVDHTVDAIATDFNEDEPNRQIISFTDQTESDQIDLDDIGLSEADLNLIGGDEIYTGSFEFNAASLVELIRTGVDPNQVNPNEIDFNQFDSYQVDPNQQSSSELDSNFYYQNSDGSEIDINQLSEAEVQQIVNLISTSNTEFGLTEADVAEAGIENIFYEISLTNPDPSKIGIEPTKSDPTKTKSIRPKSKLKKSSKDKLSSEQSGPSGLDPSKPSEIAPDIPGSNESPSLPSPSEFGPGTFIPEIPRPSVAWPGTVPSELSFIIPKNIQTEPSKNQSNEPGPSKPLSPKFYLEPFDLSKSQTKPSETDPKIEDPIVPVNIETESSGSKTEPVPNKTDQEIEDLLLQSSSESESEPMSSKTDHKMEDHTVPVPSRTNKMQDSTVLSSNETVSVDSQAESMLKKSYHKKKKTIVHASIEDLFNKFLAQPVTTDPTLPASNKTASIELQTKSVPSIPQHKKKDSDAPVITEDKSSGSQTEIMPSKYDSTVPASTKPVSNEPQSQSVLSKPYHKKKSPTTPASIQDLFNKFQTKSVPSKLHQKTTNSTELASTETVSIGQQAESVLNKSDSEQKELNDVSSGSQHELVPSKPLHIEKDPIIPSITKTMVGTQDVLRGSQVEPMPSKFYREENDPTVPAEPVSTEKDVTVPVITKRVTTRSQTKSGLRKFYHKKKDLKPSKFPDKKKDPDVPAVTETVSSGSQAESMLSEHYHKKEDFDATVSPEGVLSEPQTSTKAEPVPSKSDRKEKYTTVPASTETASSRSQDHKKEDFDAPVSPEGVLSEPQTSTKAEPVPSKSDRKEKYSTVPASTKTASSRSQDHKKEDFDAPVSTEDVSSKSKAELVPCKSDRKEKYPTVPDTTDAVSNKFQTKPVPDSTKDVSRRSQTKQVPRKLHHNKPVPSKKDPEVESEQSKSYHKKIDSGSTSTEEMSSSSQAKPVLSKSHHHHKKKHDTKTVSKAKSEHSELYHKKEDFEKPVCTQDVLSSSQTKPVPCESSHKEKDARVPESTSSASRRSQTKRVPKKLYDNKKDFIVPPSTKAVSGKSVHSKSYHKKIDSGASASSSEDVSSGSQTKHVPSKFHHKKKDSGAPISTNIMSERDRTKLVLSKSYRKKENPIVPVSSGSEAESGVRKSDHKPKISDVPASPKMMSERDRGKLVLSKSYRKKKDPIVPVSSGSEVESMLSTSHESVNTEIMSERNRAKLVLSKSYRKKKDPIVDSRSESESVLGQYDQKNKDSSSPVSSEIMSDRDWAKRGLSKSYHKKKDPVPVSSKTVSSRSKAKSEHSQSDQKNKDSSTDSTEIMSERDRAKLVLSKSYRKNKNPIVPSDAPVNTEIKSERDRAKLSYRKKKVLESSESEAESVFSKYYHKRKVSSRNVSSESDAELKKSYHKKKNFGEPAITQNPNVPGYVDVGSSKSYHTPSIKTSETMPKSVSSVPDTIETVPLPYSIPFDVGDIPLPPPIKHVPDKSHHKAKETDTSSTSQHSESYTVFGHIETVISKLVRDESFDKKKETDTSSVSQHIESDIVPGHIEAVPSIPIPHKSHDKKKKTNTSSGTGKPVPTKSSRKKSGPVGYDYSKSVASTSRNYKPRIRRNDRGLFVPSRYISPNSDSDDNPSPPRKKSKPQKKQFSLSKGGPFKSSKKSLPKKSSISEDLASEPEQCLPTESSISEDVASEFQPKQSEPTVSPKKCAPSESSNSEPKVSAPKKSKDVSSESSLNQSLPKEYSFSDDVTNELQLKQSEPIGFAPSESSNSDDIPDDRPSKSGKTDETGKTFESGNADETAEADESDQDIESDKDVESVEYDKYVEFDESGQDSETVEPDESDKDDQLALPKPNKRSIASSETSPNKTGSSKPPKKLRGPYRKKFRPAFENAKQKKKTKKKDSDAQFEKLGPLNYYDSHAAPPIDLHIKYTKRSIIMRTMRKLTRLNWSNQKKYEKNKLAVLKMLELNEIIFEKCFFKRIDCDGRHFYTRISEEHFYAMRYVKNMTKDLISITPWERTPCPDRENSSPLREGYIECLVNIFTVEQQELVTYRDAWYSLIFHQPAYIVEDVPWRQPNRSERGILQEMYGGLGMFPEYDRNDTDEDEEEDEESDE